MKKPVKAKSKVNRNLTDVRVSIGTLAEDNLIAYGTYTIMQRAIPMIYDGLKPVHRRIMYTMYKTGLFNNVAHRKAAKVVGDCMGNYHPHGDAAIYGAMVGLSSGNGTPLALIDGQGNWGSFDASGPTKGAAASRYTECRLTKYATDILVPRQYMDNAVITYIKNYDGSTDEPMFLPSLLPTLFMLGAEGIATGVTVSMPSYTYSSVLAATKVLFKTGEGRKAVRKLVPNQRWGSELQSEQADLDAYHKTGQGKLQWAPPYTVRRDKNGTVLSMTAIPPMGWETLYNGLMNIKGVYSVIDLSSKKNGLLIEVTVKDEAALPAVKKKLVVSESYRSAATILVDKPTEDSPQQVEFRTWTPIQIIEAWMKWRIDLEKRLVQSLIRDNEAEIARLNLLIVAANHLEAIFEILKAKTGDKIAMIEKRLKVNNEDAKTIWSLAVGRLDKLNVDDTKRKLEELRAHNKTLAKDYKMPVERIMAAINKLPDIDPNEAKKRKPVS